ncbi:MAG: hypothetical protein PVI75_07565 [Gammaproteobacteria bacterium]|jgi:hypothetical protein
MFKTKTIDINRYPKRINIPDNISTINFGSMHGNALKLLHLLIAYGIIKISRNTYNEFVSFYDLKKGKFITSDGEEREHTDLTTDMIVICTSHINAIKVSTSKKYLLRFFGGLLKGNLTHVFLIGKILEKLCENKNIEYTIIPNKDDLNTIARTYKQPDVTTSPYGNTDFDKCFLSKCRLVGYENDKLSKIIFIYTCAPIAFEKIKNFAKKFVTGEGKNNIKWNNADDLYYSIVEINTQFLVYLKNKKEFFAKIVPQLQKVDNPPTKYENLLEYAIANNSIESRYFDENYKHNGCKVIIVCSKRILKKNRKNVVNLYSYDNKFDYKNKKDKPNKHKYKVYMSFTQEPQEKNANVTVQPNKFFKPKKQVPEQIPRKHKKETFGDIIKNEMLGLFYQLVPQFLLDLFNCRRQKERGQKDRNNYEKIARCLLRRW